MAINIKLETDKCKENLTETVHSIPCCINYNGNAAVSTFFTPYMRKHPDDSRISVNTFRGRPLYGREQNVPQNYIGVVLEEPGGQMTDCCERTFKVSNTFTKFTYWNWDQMPSENDAFPQTLDWIEVSEAIHKPVAQNSKDGGGDLDISQSSKKKAPLE